MLKVNMKSDIPTYRALLAWNASANRAAEEAQLDPLLVELVRLRVSQINGCAYCLREHTGDSLAKGELPERLAVLSAWRESHFFTDQEQDALILAEGITNIANSPVTQEQLTSISKSLSPVQVSAIAWIATAINALNRLAITSHYYVGPLVPMMNADGDGAA